MLTTDQPFPKAWEYIPDELSPHEREQWVELVGEPLLGPPPSNPLLSLPSPAPEVTSNSDVKAFADLTREPKTAQTATDSHTSRPAREELVELLGPDKGSSQERHESQHDTLSQTYADRAEGRRKEAMNQKGKLFQVLTASERQALDMRLLRTASIKLIAGGPSMLHALKVEAESAMECLNGKKVRRAEAQAIAAAQVMMSEHQSVFGSSGETATEGQHRMSQAALNLVQQRVHKDQRCFIISPQGVKGKANTIDHYLVRAAPYLDEQVEARTKLAELIQDQQTTPLPRLKSLTTKESVSGLTTEKRFKKEEVLVEEEGKGDEEEEGDEEDEEEQEDADSDYLPQSSRDSEEEEELLENLLSVLGVSCIELKTLGVFTLAASRALLRGLLVCGADGQELYLVFDGKTWKPEWGMQSPLFTQTMADKVLQVVQAMILCNLPTGMLSALEHFLIFKRLPNETDMDNSNRAISLLVSPAMGGSNVIMSAPKAQIILSFLNPLEAEPEVDRSGNEKRSVPMKILVKKGFKWSDVPEALS